MSGDVFKANGPRRLRERFDVLRNSISRHHRRPKFPLKRTPQSWTTGRFEQHRSVCQHGEMRKDREISDRSGEGFSQTKRIRPWRVALRRSESSPAITEGINLHQAEARIPSNPRSPATPTLFKTKLRIGVLSPLVGTNSSPPS